MNTRRKNNQCSRGHEMTYNNTKYYSNGRTACRECLRLNQRETRLLQEAKISQSKTKPGWKKYLEKQLKLYDQLKDIDY
jgi:late competence protein required for DNA uptake (superfamily II DNA/RNA helicase)